MCGLVSVIIKDNTKVMNKEMIEMFKQMLYADALRGWDSTGICAVKGSNKTHIFKEALAAGTFLYRLKDSEWTFQNRGIIGHNRWATRGSVNAENAHPFKEGHIILAHNGTLKSHHALKNVQVDSHAICHSISEQGAIPTLEKLDGAYALIWFDEKTNEFYATRNNERPLYIVETDDLFIVVSEAELAKWICARNNVQVRKTTNCVPGTLYKFKESAKNRIFIETVKYKLFVPAPYVPPVYKPPVQQQLTLPDNVTQIRPLVPDPDHTVVVGESLDVLFWKKKTHKYDNYKLGKVEWEVDILEPKGNIRLEVYTDDETDYTEMAGTVKVDKVYYSQHLAKFIVIASNPSVKKKTVADETGPITTSNGIKLTNEVLEKNKDTLCIFCQAPFSKLIGDDLPKIVLNPHAQKGHVYKYVYYCPECVEYFNIMGKRNVV